MKLTGIRIPSPRKTETHQEMPAVEEEAPALAFRRRLLARAPSTKELRRRLARD